MLGSLLFCVVLATTAVGDDPASSAADRPTDRTAYEAARKEAGHDAQAQVRLALWCEQHGMTAERMKHLAAAVLQDPSNALARGLMGLVARGGKWERPDEVSREARGRPQAEGPAGGISPAPGQGGRTRPTTSGGWPSGASRTG